MKTVLSESKSITEKKQRIAFSAAQDISYAVTNGCWKMPKHVVLGTAIHHLIGSAEVISILNHFGHCILYCSVLELETTICLNLLQIATLLPSMIMKDNNQILHFAWDNFDLSEETVRSWHHAFYTWYCNPRNPEKIRDGKRVRRSAV